MRRLMALGLSALLLAACGGAVEDGAGAEPVETTAGGEGSSIAPTTRSPESDGLEPSAPEPTPAPEDFAAIPEPSPLAGVAMADLAKLLDVDYDLIHVVVVEAVTWRDGSIGCPEPGMSYTQALVPGTRIILEHAGTEYHYHTTDRVDPFYCATPTEPFTGSPSDS